MNIATENLVERLLEPVFQSMPAASAQRIVDLKADDILQQRVEALARKANEGNLSQQERDEYQACIDAGDVLATLQALARRSLEKSAH